MSYPYPTASPMLNPKAVRVHDWPHWRGTTMDLVMYAGYLWGKGVTMGPPWLTWADSVRLGAGSTLCLTISNVNGLVLTVDNDKLPTQSDSELIDKVVHAITTHITSDATLAFNCLNTEHDFMRNSERKLYELRHVCNNNILTPTNEK
jgi:hypothetical protein